MEVARRRRRPTSFGEIRSIDNRQSVPPTYTAVIPICMDWSGAAAPSFRRMEMPTNRKELLARTRRKAFGSIGRLGLTVETIIQRGNKKKKEKKKFGGHAKERSAGNIENTTILGRRALSIYTYALCVSVVVVVVVVGISIYQEGGNPTVPTSDKSRVV